MGDGRTSVLDVLFCHRRVRRWEFMSVGALLPPRALSLKEEGADVLSVPLVARVRPGHALEHLLARGGGTQRVKRQRRGGGRSIGQLAFQVLGVVLCGPDEEDRVVRVRLDREEGWTVENLRLLMSLVGASLIRPSATSLTWVGRPYSL